MALWEYKIISSGKGGFGSPALLETHLNQLGKDEWEIIAFHTQPDNPLAFQGLARRTTQRDWTLEDAAAAAAKAEAENPRGIRRQVSGGSGEFIPGRRGRGQTRLTRGGNGRWGRRAPSSARYRSGSRS
jgi:hypothetical protein